MGLKAKLAAISASRRFFFIHCFLVTLVLADGPLLHVFALSYDLGDGVNWRTVAQGDASGNLTEGRTRTNVIQTRRGEAGTAKHRQPCQPGIIPAGMETQCSEWTGELPRGDYIIPPPSFAPRLSPQRCTVSGCSVLRN